MKPMIAIGTRLTLREFDRKLAVNLGKQRYLNDVRARLNDQRISKILTSEQAHIEGAEWEVALARALDLEPDLDTSAGKYRYKDMTTFDNVDIDAKHTRYTNGRLMVYVNKAKLGKGHWYALGCGMSPTFVFRGFFFSDDLHVKSRIIDIGNGPTYAATQSELLPDYRKA